MRAFVLAAGLGTRLRPWTERTPKPLMPCGGEPLLRRAIRQLHAAGVRDIGVNGFHLSEQIGAWVASFNAGEEPLARALGGARPALTFFDEQPALLGTGGGLKHAEAFLRAETQHPGDANDRFLLVNGDVCHTFDLARLASAADPSALATMAVHRTPRRPELHVVHCSDSGHITAIREDGDRLTPGFDAIFSGVSVLSGALLDGVPRGRMSGIVSHAILPALLDGRGDVRWLEPAGDWFDCGTPAELTQASRHVLGARRVTG